MAPKIILFILSFAVLSCSDKTVEKPENLIEKETMEKILYDLALLQAVKGHDASLLQKNSINPKTYIYQKYKIDSTQFVKSNIYYSSDITEYKKMYDNVIAKIAEEKKIIDAKFKKELQAEQKKIRDSIIKSSKNKKTAVNTKG